MPNAKRKTAPDWHRGAAQEVRLDTREFPAFDGRAQVLERLLTACLYDRDMCALLDRHRDGIVLKIPPLRELHRIRGLA